MTEANMNEINDLNATPTNEAVAQMFVTDFARILADIGTGAPISLVTYGPADKPSLLLLMASGEAAASLFEALKENGVTPADEALAAQPTATEIESDANPKRVPETRMGRPSRVRGSLVRAGN